MADLKPPNITLVEDKLWVLAESIGLPQYDFRFEDHFLCRHPFRLDTDVSAVARLGAAKDYEKRYKRLKKWGVELVHSPKEYALTSNLPLWYPLINDLTPKSIWYDQFPTVREIEHEFNWPIFIKGERQTSKHDRSKAIIESPEHFENLARIWRYDPILHWQKPVCREFVPLKPVAGDFSGQIPKSYEFRTFWWKTDCMGIGPYWFSESYQPLEDDVAAIKKIGTEVARRLDVTFLVIDIALTLAGDWIVIECNDGQDSGYAGIRPRNMWYRVLNQIKA